MENVQVKKGRGHFFKKYLPFTKSGILNLFAYRFNLFTWFVLTLLQLVCFFFLWIAVYKNSPVDTINGFTLKEMVNYVTVMTITSFLINQSSTQDMISDEISDGSIALSLIKPISYRIRFIFLSLGGLIGTFIVIGFPALLLSLGTLSYLGYFEIGNVWLFIARVALYLVFVLLATWLIDCINYFFGICTFYTMASFGMFQLRMVFISFLSGTMIPLSFFPSWAEDVLKFSPFAGMGQNPTMILLGKMDWKMAAINIGVAVVWIIVLEAINSLFYRNAIKHVTIQGG